MPNNEPASSRLDFEKLKTLEADVQLRLFQEYSTWARHHHSLIWAAGALGVTIAIAVFLMYSRVGALPYSVIALGGLYLLLCSHMLAEGNRRQWADYKSVPNMLEAVWGLRARSSQNALNALERKKTIHVQPWRRRLYCALAAVTLASVVAKWCEWYGDA